jgi:hypothetical protein
MKKLFTLLFIIMGVLVANAQIVTRSGGSSTVIPGNNPVVKTLNDVKAIGDTLFYFNGREFFINPTDAPLWSYLDEDLDGLTPANGSDVGAFFTYYDTSGSAAIFMPWEVASGADTAFFQQATSWFSPAAEADNWLEFGPITLPAGAELSWYQRFNGGDATPPYWLDGYEVLLSTTGMANYGTFLDAPVFSRPSICDTFGDQAVDTSWALKTVAIPASYCNQPCYFAFHHNAFDMDVLWIDEIKIVEATAGIAETANGISFVQNIPNPAKDQTVISYQLNNSANVSLQVNDITGREVFATNFGVQSAGANQYTLNTSAFAPGIYVYTLMVNNSKVVKKMTVVK